MICFKDMAFCSLYPSQCKNDKCPRAFTENLRKEAIEWWGTVDVPVAYSSVDNCPDLIPNDEKT